MSKAFRAMFVVFLVAAAMTALTEASGWGREPPCDEVCPRIKRERDECCRAHGHAVASWCYYGQMYCYDY
ncbi:spodomicin-like [Leguminivora glycinivorella]|uniref:spodomicin-like n=1 Tax=Leguminivora glycinivorella TaxID=1035111 RepID=UPI00200C5256|nr:spodomicin-like [Leguminivora glycinivorella]